ncbi:hypothetical protein KIW84_055652, partial [Lathyrus oleraceus]
TKLDTTRAFLLGNKFSTNAVTLSSKTSCISCTLVRSKLSPNVGGPVEKDKKGKKIEHHLWKKRDSAQSGQKALALVRTVCLRIHSFFSRILLIIFDLTRQLSQQGRKSQDYPNLDFV